MTGTPLSASACSYFRTRETLFRLTSFVIAQTAACRPAAVILSEGTFGSAATSLPRLLLAPTIPPTEYFEVGSGPCLLKSMQLA